MRGPRLQARQISMSFRDKVLTADENFVDLIFGVGVFAFFFVVALGEKIFVAAFDDGFEWVWISSTMRRMLVTLALREH